MFSNHIWLAHPLITIYLCSYRYTWHLFFNPIPHGGGHYGPDDRKRSAVSTGFGLGSPKFLTLFLSMSDKTQ